MDTHDPIVCSLDADELKQRLAEIRAVGADALGDVQSLPGQAVLRFAASQETRRHLEAIVAAEARCCAFLSFDLREEPGAIVMTISAPEGAEPVVRDLVGAFSGKVAA